MEQMPTKRSGIAAAASPVDGNIYVFGGENPFKYEGPVKTFDIVERYNPKTNTWTIEQPMPTARNGLAATSYDNKIYVIVGGNKPGLFVGNVNKVLSLNSSNAIE
jgi:N-acetylneuraminic acid mutarotase